MKKFSFRLSSVLRLREGRLTMEKTLLANFLSEEQKILGKICKISAQCDEQHASIRELSTLRSGDLRAFSAYILSSQTQVIALQEKLVQIRHAIAIRRQAVLRAEQDVKVMLKLKEKRLREWQRGQDRMFETVSQEAWLAAHHKIVHEKTSFPKMKLLSEASMRTEESDC